MSEENNSFESSSFESNNQGNQYTQAPDINTSYSGNYDSYGNGNPSGKGQSNGFGIASMVCGILALITCCLWCTVIPLGVVAIVLGILQIVKNENKGMAIAGIVCAAIGLILFIVLTIYGNYLEATGQYNEILWQYQQILDQLNN